MNKKRFVSRSSCTTLSWFVSRKMDIDMEDAKYTDGNGKTVRLENFHVRGRKVRYVHIPDQVSRKTWKNREFQGKLLTIWYSSHPYILSHAIISLTWSYDNHKNVKKRCIIHEIVTNYKHEIIEYFCHTFFFSFKIAKIKVSPLLK